MYKHMCCNVPSSECFSFFMKSEFQILSYEVFFLGNCFLFLMKT